ncbi:hypothetical protein XELAEV_18013130mg [Xenopus laevis]|uniref:FERM, ARHGEF and pleckstrin domain-containing protein 1 n=1 Tax=Xenopus laevis TaxID=8355 RepID=A0A974DNT8_XENLA|nr:hypothetical protein XELAEV_18013130mg [Xenopus laevis]
MGVRKQSVLRSENGEIRAPGKTLLDAVCSHLNLVEGDYFGLEFQDHRKIMVWLDLLKPIVKQIRISVVFLVRYLFALQVKQDLVQGKLTCNESSAALLISHIVQSEIGDFDEAGDQEHLLKNKYMPQQEPLEEKIMELHRNHFGQTPAESDFQLLEIARRLEMYGIRLHPAKDREGTKINLAVANTGILVFQSSYQDTLEFMMASRDFCKSFWKICVEYHAFFRLFEEPKPKPKPVLFSRGSSFRFSGRTQKQVLDYVREGGHKKVQFERKHSKICSIRSQSSHRPEPLLEVPKQSSNITFEQSSQPDEIQTLQQVREDKRVVDVPVQHRSPSPNKSPVAKRTKEGIDVTADGEDAAKDHSQKSLKNTHQQSTGPASRAARGSSTSIPYIDCSDVDSEYDIHRAYLIRSQSQTNDNYEADFHSNNAMYRTDDYLKHSKLKQQISSVRSSSNIIEEYIDDDPEGLSFYTGGSPQMPRHSSLIDEMFSGPDSRSPLAAPLSPSSKGSSPNLRFKRTGSQSYVSENGYDNNNWARQLEDDDLGINCQMYGNCSPALERPCIQKLKNLHRNHSETDPFILSQIASTPTRDYRAEEQRIGQISKMAAVETKMISNGMFDSKQSKYSPRLRASMVLEDHIGGVSMVDGSTSSGSETSDGDSDILDTFSHPLVYGNPVVLNSSPIPKNKYSFGSLHLDEYAEDVNDEVDTVLSFSDEDAHVLFADLNVNDDVSVGTWLPGSLTGSPHLSELSINSQGGLIGLNPSLSPNLSPDGKPSSPLISPLLHEPACIRTDDEEESRKKKFPTDKAYFIAKEVSTTECTYLKDLEVITKWFQNAVGKDDAMPESLRNLIFPNFDPLHKFHTSFLKEVDQRLGYWEGRSNSHMKADNQKIGDVMLKNIQGMKQLTTHLQKHYEALIELEKAMKNSRKLESMCRDFEQEKVCYLPLNTFFLQPLHRLMHYKQIMERLCKHYPPNDVDFRDSRAALAEITELVAQLHGTMIKMENFQKLQELRKDLTGLDNLVIPGREFIRLGSLSKLSGKGLQQRMFFLFNDVMIYTSRGLTSTNQFKVHGQLPLFNMTIEESEDEWGVPHCLTLRSQNQSIIVAASTRPEVEKWSEDIQMAIDLAENSSGPVPELLASSPPDGKTPEEGSTDQESEDDLSASRTSLERQSPHRGNTTVHVCWHRNTSVSMIDFSLAVENQFSGNLLRKFKNSNGWQKLWVVFTNFCLFFYKSHQDSHPLASLPLLGYSLTIPSESENIHKDYVFKLHFKWMEVIRSATDSASRSRILSRKELHMY